MDLFGRRIIYSDEKEINRSNILAVLEQANAAHQANRSEIRFLYDYYKGKQPILARKKEVRPEICNRIVENRANEIVAFKVGYLCGEPVQYVGRTSDEQISKEIAMLNEMMLSEGKAAKDKELVEWQMICGTAFRMVLPDAKGREDDAPFELFTLNPQNTFVIYSSLVGNRPLAGVYYVTDSLGTQIYSIYTENRYFEVKAGSVVKDEAHSLGYLPIIEYPANNARLGAFETVIPILDAINTVASNRLDGIEQFIQAIMVFENCGISREQFAELREQGAIQVKSDANNAAKVYYLVEQLDQSQTQTLVDYMYQTVLTICGMPNRNGGSSTSDTGNAVIMRDGWTLAEARAKDSELMFKQSEQRFLKLILRICRDLSGLNLRLKDIDTKFTRRNYENIQTKGQVLVSMLNNQKIDPRLAFIHCGMFSDPEAAYLESMKYYQESAVSAVADKTVERNTLNSQGGERTPGEKTQEREIEK